MDEQTGTKIRGMTVKQGHKVDCRDWLEFAILEVKYDGIRVRYLEFDKEKPCHLVSDVIQLEGQ